MAAAYWQLKASPSFAPVWSKASGTVTAGPTVGRIIDAIISDGYAAALREKAGPFTFSNVKDLLSRYYSPPSTQIAGKLAEILELPETQMAQKISNVKRSLLTYSAVDFFGYFLSLFAATGFPKFVIFLDQFEEYVQSHLTRISLQRLDDDFRDLVEGAAGRTCLILSLHARAEDILSGLGYSRRAAPVDSSSKITIEPLREHDGVELAEAYLHRFRIPGFSGPELYPFESRAVEYITRAVGGNPGKLIEALGKAIDLAHDEGVQAISYPFLLDPKNHVKILGLIAPKQAA
jgi:hypothetical protein